MYTLTFPTGTVIKFYVRSCAEIFQQCYGGVLAYRDRVPGETAETY